MTQCLTINAKYLMGKIYCMYSESDPDLKYIGSTTMSLKKRFMSHHQKPPSTLMAKFFQKHNDVAIRLVESYPCLTKQHLRSREQYYIDKYRACGKALLNCQNACPDNKPFLLRKSLVENFRDQHPHHKSSIDLILLRDYTELKKPTYNEDGIPDEYDIDEIVTRMSRVCSCYH